MANPDFHALFSPNVGPDFKGLFAPDEITEQEANRTLTPEEQTKVVPQGRTWGDVGREALGNAPRSALNAGKNFLWGLTPVPAFQRFNRIINDPLGESAATRKHYRDFTTEEGIKEKLATDPVGTVAEVVGYAPPMRAVRGAVRPSGPAPIPRGSVRTGEELLSTGGKRIEEAKLNPSKVDKEALGTPLREFREKTKTTVLTSPIVINIARRLETAHTPNPPGAMEAITKVGAKPKPDLTLTELHGHSQRLDDFIGKGGKGIDGRINNQGRAAIELKNAINKMIENHPSNASLKIGKHEYHRGKMSQTMDDILKSAQGRRQWANGDEAGALGAEVALYLKNKKNRYALTPEVRRKLDKLSRDKRGRLIGSLGATNMGGFTFGRLVEAAVGLPPGTGMIAGVPMRNARNARIVAEFKKIQEELRAGGPVGN